MWVIVRKKPNRAKNDQYTRTMLQRFDGCKSLRKYERNWRAAAIVRENRFENGFNPFPLILHLLLRNNSTLISVGHDHDLVLRFHLTYDFPHRCARGVDHLPIST